jgi:sterol desaturase/sphingolipid hydroxylase (fatty acid hydroxylase superfamily)
MATLHRPHALPQETASRLLRRMLQVITYFGEICVGPFLAIFLFASSSRPIGNAAALTATGVIAWTLAEYFGHRFVLHRLAPTEHRLHHAHPGEPVLSISWQIWACFGLLYLIVDGAFLTGLLVAYAWYLFVHHCTHHSADRLPAFLVRYHNGHHKFATRNYGVTTSLWDHVFGTVLR